MSDASIRGALDRVKLRFRALSLAKVLAGLAAAILLALSIEVAVDQILPLPRWFRVVALLGGFISAAAIGYRLLAGPLGGRVSDLFVARSIEGRYAGLKSGLITYVQLSTDGEESAALREIVGERVSEQIVEVRPEIVVPSIDLRRAAACLGGAVGFLLLLVAISPSGFWHSFRRSVLPTRIITETQIAEVLPGNAPTYKGRDVEIAMRATGKLPPTAQLWVSRSSSDPVRIELPQRKDGWYRGVLPGVTEGFTYWVAAHDATSDDYRIRIAEVPRLKSLAATLHFPKYTAFPPRKQDSGNVDAIEGTTVVLEGAATRPLSSAVLRMQGKRVPAVELRGERFSFGFTLGETADYAIELTDQDGNADPEPSKFRAVARKDAAPQVTITIPGKNVEVPAPAPLRLACKVVDDFGLTALTLTARVNGKVPKTVRLPVPKERLFVGEPTLDLPALEVGAGDYVEYFLTATDNKEPSPQQGQSATYVVTVQSSLPLLTFVDVNPDVRVEKYRDPLERKGSVEPKAEKPLADDRTKDGGKSQEPPRRDPAKKDVFRIEEKKPESRKEDPATAEAGRADGEAPREDSLARLLEEKKDLVQRLLAKAGQDAAGDARSQGREGAESRNGDGHDEAGEARAGKDTPGAASESSERAERDGAGKGARKGTGEGARAGKNAAPGDGANPGDGEGASGGDDGTPGGSDAAPGTGATGNKASKPGKPGRPGRPGREGDGGDGEDGDEGDDDGDDDDDFDLADLFPFNGGT